MAVIEHMIGGDDSIRGNIVGYYYLDRAAYNDYLYENKESAIQDYLNSVL